jgi:hypothetical protein
MLRRVALVRTDVSEELSASIIRVTRMGELGTLAVTSNGRKLRRNTISVLTRAIQRNTPEDGILRDNESSGSAKLATGGFSRSHLHVVRHRIFIQMHV